MGTLGCVIFLANAAAILHSLTLFNHMLPNALTAKIN